MTHLKNIIIIHKAAIGDSLLALPVIYNLKEKFNYEIIYFGHEFMMDFFKESYLPIDNFISVDKPFLELRSDFVKYRPDFIIDLTNNTKTKLATFGFETYSYKKVKSIHALDNYLLTLKPIMLKFDINSELEPKYPKFKLVDFDSISLSQKNIAIALGVGLKRANRRWPLPKWQELIERLSNYDIKIHLIGGSDEQSMDIKYKSTKVENYIGKLSLYQTACLLNKCDLLICGDTGPMHLAQAIGTKVIGLLGPTLALRSGPYFDQDLCVSQNSACRCINQRVCSVTNSDVSYCMNLIETDEILQLILSQLDMCK